jgi:hypothetical protein
MRKAEWSSNVHGRAVGFALLLIVLPLVLAWVFAREGDASGALAAAVVMGAFAAAGVFLLRRLHEPLVPDLSWTLILGPFLLFGIAAFEGGWHRTVRELGAVDAAFASGSLAAGALLRLLHRRQ